MNRTLSALYVLLLMMLLSSAALADPALDLTVGKSGVSAALSWTGGAPDYQIYRSTSATDLLDAANLIAVRRDNSFVENPAAGGLFFYQVQQRANCFNAQADSFTLDSLPTDNFGYLNTLSLQEAPGRAVVQVRFSLGMIPQGAQILSADLELHEQTFSGPVQVSVGRLRSNWSEYGIQWNNQPLRDAPTDFASFPTGNWQRWSVTSAVQEMIDGGVANFGFQLEPFFATPTMAFDSRESEFPPRICIRWEDPVSLGIEQLYGNSEIQDTAVVIEEDTTHFVGRTDASNFAGDPVLQALEYLVVHGAAYGLTDPQAELYLERIERGENTGDYDVIFGQRYEDNVRVERASMSVHLREDKVISVSSRLLLPVPPLEPVQATGWEATNRVLEEYAPSARDTIGSPELVVWHASPLDPNPKLAAYAYRVNAIGLIALEERWETAEFFVDAVSGEILERRSLEEDSGDRVGEDFDIETVNNTSPSGSGGCWNSLFTTADDDWFDECGDNGYDSSADPSNQGPDAESFTHQTWHYFDDLLLWSWNGEGGEVEVMVYADVPNANYSRVCDQMRFRNGWLTDDIMTHEFTHGVTYHGSNLGGSNMSGALGENMADTFAAYADPDDPWLIGEDRGAIRSLEDPTLFGDPDHRSNLCSANNSYCCTTWPCDAGAVHTNSGVGNKAAYLIAAGGIHNGIQIDGIGLQKAGRLYRLLATNWNTSGSTYNGFYLNMIALARQKVELGQENFNTGDVCDVINAWSSVGYGLVDADCDGWPDGRIDGDRDGIFNTADNCVNIRNPNQEDVDGDGFGDPCDNDADGDGLPNVDDNCPLVANADQADHDSNGDGDLCDDQDGDGVTVLVDNCVDEYNPSQGDSDNDGIGNFCDPDRDGDGLDNEVDNCPYRYNPSQSDSDGDNFGNVCDNCPSLPNPQKDCNGDGIGDDCQDDDDQDGVPDEDDNCRCVENPDQAEVDGINGFMCDPEVFAQLDGLKEEAFLIFAAEQILEHPIRIPFGPCVEDCPDWLPAGTFTQVDVSLTDPRHVRVIDDRGYVVGDLKEISPGQYRLQFEPDTSYHYVSPGLNELPYSNAQAEQPFNLRTYTLEIIAVDPNSSTTFDAVVQVQTTLGQP